MMDMDRLLEDTQCDFWWYPADIGIVTRKEITYTHSKRQEKLYNAVVRVQNKSAKIPRLVQEVLSAHAGVPSEWRLAAPSLSDSLEKTLEDEGYRLNTESITYTLGVDAARPADPDHIVVRHIQTAQGIIDQHAVMDRAFDRKGPLSQPDIAQHLRNSTGPNARTHRFVAYSSTSEEPLCTASFNSYPALGVGFLWGGGTVPDARGQGLYTAIMTARIRHARKLGLHTVGLYAMTNTSAPIVAAQGFDAHGPVRFWGKDRA